MTVPIPDLPGHDTPNWDTTWAVGINAKLADFESRVSALEAVAGLSASGLVKTVNGITPDPSGDVPLGPTDVNAMAAGYKPQYSDLPQGFVTYVYKDATTGFWPASWNADGTANYTSGSASAGVRPHALPQPVIWVGAEPSPAQVSSGTGGMLQGYDERAIPNP